MNSVRRWSPFVWVLAGALAGFVLGSAIPLLWAQAQDGATARTEIVGRHPNHSTALVSHAGALNVTCQTAAGVAESCAGAAGDTVNVFHESTIRHVSSVTHVSIRFNSTTGADHLLVAPVYQAGPWNVSGAQSGSWTVQAAHQGGEWNVRHVTSVTHVAIRFNSTTGADHLLVAPVYQAGPWNVSAAQSGPWTVQAAHQGGQWNVAHVASVLHVSIIPGGSTGANHLQVGPVYQAGTWNTGILGRPNVGLGALVTHTGQLGVTCFTNAGVAETCGGSGGSGDAVNVFHESTIRHVSSQLHVAGLLPAISGAGQSAPYRLVGQGPPGIYGAWPVSAHQAGQSGNVWRIDHVTSVLHVSIQQGTGTGAQHLLVAPVYQAGTWTVQPGNTQNTTAWLANIQHVSPVLHVSLRFNSTTGADHVLVAPVYQAGTWTVQPGNTPNTTAWLVNMQHNSSVLHVAIRQGTGTGADHLVVAPIYQAGPWVVNVPHISSVLHVSLRQGTGTGADHLLVSSTVVNFLAPRLTVAHVSSVTHVAIVQGSAGGASHLLVAPVYQAGTWTVQPGNTQNTTAWLMNTQHISSVVHVSIVGGANSYQGQTVLGHVGVGHTFVLTHVVVVHYAGGIGNPPNHLVARTFDVPVHTRAGRDQIQRINASDANYRILHENNARIAFIIYNHAASSSATTMYVKLGQHATVDSFSLLLTGGATYECWNNCYTGDIDAVWRDQTTGVRASVTEISR